MADLLLEGAPDRCPKCGGQLKNWKMAGRVRHMRCVNCKQITKVRVEGADVCDCFDCRMRNLNEGQMKNLLMSLDELHPHVKAHIMADAGFDEGWLHDQVGAPQGGKLHDAFAEWVTNTPTEEVLHHVQKHVPGIAK